VKGKVNEVCVALKGSFLTDMGHSISPCPIFFSLLPSTSTLLKFSPYNRALYTIKPSLTPPPTAAPSVWSRDTGHLSSERGAGGNSKPSMGAPHWAWQLSMLLHRIAEYSQVAVGEKEKRRDRDEEAVSVCLQLCVSPPHWLLFCKVCVFVCVCVCVFGPTCTRLLLFSLRTKLDWGQREG